MRENLRNGLYTAAEELSLPAEVMGESGVEISGYRRILLIGHKGIRSYSTTEIVVDFRDHAIRVTGRDLGLRSMTKNELLISGTLDGVGFIR